MSKLTNYLDELEKEGKREENFPGCSITSMHEDFEIMAVGREKLKIVSRIREILALELR